MTESSTNRPDAVQLRARRNPRLIALGVLLVVLGALGAAALYTTVSNHRQAVAAARDIARGTELQRGDLTVIEVPSDYDYGLPPQDLETLIGQRTLVDLPAGSLPEARHLGEMRIAPGTSLVGLKLGPGRLPTSELTPGQPVRLVTLTGEATAISGTVMTAPVQLEDGFTWVLDVAVADAEANLAASYAAQDQLALIVLAGS
ncbi:MAG: SAF domain-containing protein [Propionibacteriaceae bacterium]|nr:SAF domain-containing protein [Propionibacteriaceae bacterium]